MLLLLLVGACSDGTISVVDDPPDPAPSVTGPAALDPLYGRTASFELAGVGGDVVAIEVRDAAGAVVEVLADGTTWVESVAWNARDASGAAVPLGRYTL